MLVFADPLLSLMAADSTIIEASATYIRIESVANIFSMLSNFALVVLVTLNKDKYVYIITASKVVLCIVADTFLVSTLPVSANLGVNGIGVSNILVNVLLLAVTIMLLYREGVKVFERRKLSFVWIKEFFRSAAYRAGIARKKCRLYAYGRANGKRCQRAGHILGCK